MTTTEGPNATRTTAPPSRRVAAAPTRRAPRLPAGRWPVRGPSRASRARCRRGRSGRTRAAGRPRRSPGRDRGCQRAVEQVDLDQAARRAPLVGVAEQVRDRAADALGSPLTTVGCSDAWKTTRRRRGARRAHARARSGRCARRPRVARLGTACELDDVADQRRELVELGDDVGAQASRSSSGSRSASQHLDVARRLAIGVRSSWRRRRRDGAGPRPSARARRASR